MERLNRTTDKGRYAGLRGLLSVGAVLSITAFILVAVPGCPNNPPPPTPTCNSNGDCDATVPEACINSRCEAVDCLANADCDNGTFCDGAEVCTADFTCTNGTDPCVDQECDETRNVCFTACSNGAECDDGVFCNGVEECLQNVCVDGTNPCATGDTCDEATNTCVPPATECNSNGDCDDGLFCNGTEACGADGFCVDGTVPCTTGQTCDEDLNECFNVGCNSNGDCDSGQVCTTNGDCVPLTTITCTTAAQCSDGIFCNGTETCGTNGFCAAGTDPCGAGFTCSEGDTAASCIPITGATKNFTLNIDNLTGTGDADTFLAPIELTGLGAQANTLQSGDAANGLAGNDVLNAFVVNTLTAAGAQTIAPTLSGIETLNFTDYTTRAGDTFTISGTGITGATAINLTGGLNNTANAFKVDQIPAIVTMGLTNSSEDFELVYKSTATSAATDAMTLNLSNVTDGTFADRSEVRISAGAANGIETLTVNSTGGANKLNRLTQTPTAGTTSTTLATLNITGNQNLGIGALRDVGTIAAGVTVGQLDNSILTINAGTFTGSLAGSEGLIVGTGVVSFTGGSGNDEVAYAYIAAGPTPTSTYTTADTINGGTGTDVLGLLSADAAPATNQTNVTNIEGIRIINELASSPTLTRWGSGVVNAYLDDGGNGGVITYPAGTTNTLTLGAFGATDASGSGTLGATISGSGTTDALTMTLNDCDQVNVVTLTGVETLNLVSNANLNGTAASGGANVFGNAFTMTNTAAIETMNITGTDNLTFTGAVTADVINAGVTGQVFTKVLTMSALSTGAGSMTITGGDGADTLWGSVNADTINGGAGNDTIYGNGNGTPAADPGADILTGGTGADEFRFANSITAAASTAAPVITDWVDGTDILAISAGNTFSAAWNVGLAEGGGVAGSLNATAANSTVIREVAQNGASSNIGGTEQFIKLTTPVAKTGGTDQLTFDAAIGSATITNLTAATYMCGSYYDTTNGQMVVFEVYSGAANQIVAAADVIRVICRITMTTTDYTNFTKADLRFY
jgi:hypothetical protein